MSGTLSVVGETALAEAAAALAAVSGALDEAASQLSLAESARDLAGAPAWLEGVPTGFAIGANLTGAQVAAAGARLQVVAAHGTAVATHAQTLAADLRYQEGERLAAEAVRRAGGGAAWAVGVALPAVVLAVTPFIAIPLLTSLAFASVAAVVDVVERGVRGVAGLAEDAVRSLPGGGALEPGAFGSRPADDGASWGDVVRAADPVPAFLDALRAIGASIVSSPELFGSPLGQQLVRLGVEHVDSFASGLVGLPVPLDVPEPALAAGGAALATAVGVMPAASFVVSRERTKAVAGAAGAPAVGPPTGVGDLVARIPAARADGPQVSITSYENERGEVLHEVAITGTSSQAFGGANPFDHAGNLAAFGFSQEQSVAAVRQAMEDAGIRPGDAVVFAGYSQGSLVAAAIAADGTYDARSIVTIGGPVDPSRVPEGTQLVQLEHDEDPVVGLQGLPDAQPGADRVRATRPVLDGAEGRAAAEAGGPFAAHDQRLYVETAQLFDRSDDRDAVRARAALAGLYEGYQQTSSARYTVTRA